MTITLYANSSENNAMDKVITEIATLTGNLREETSMLDPVITFSDITQYVSGINYAFIHEFNRYYFITNIESVRNDVWRLSFHVDVLFTYREKIRANSAIIERNAAEYDLKLNDGLFQTQQNPRIEQYPFPAGFDTWNFVLAVAGN